MEELKIKVPVRVKDELSKIAREHGIGVERLSSAILESFILGEGKIYTGAWPEGPGMRLLVDWPKFSSQVLKIPEAEKF
jgi:hypothetical protein